MSRFLARSARALALTVVAGFTLVGCGDPAEASTPAETSIVGGGSPAPAAFTTTWADAEVESDTIVLDRLRYRLADDAQPRSGYVRKAYLPAGQRLASYERMLLVEAVAGPSVSETVDAQVAMLERRKASDPLVNMALRTDPRTGEALLDFTMGGRSEDGRPTVEWNVYRYVPIEQGGVRGVQLVGVSLRAYGTDRRAFVRDLGETRHHEISTVAAARVPAIVLPTW